MSSIFIIVEKIIIVFSHFLGLSDIFTKFWRRRKIFIIRKKMLPNLWPSLFHLSECMEYVTSGDLYIRSIICTYEERKHVLPNLFQVASNIEKHVCASQMSLIETARRHFDEKKNTASYVIKKTAQIKSIGNWFLKKMSVSDKIKKRRFII